MGKLFWQMSVTLDGFMEGPNHELDHTAQAELIKGDVAEEVARLKAQASKDLALFGSADLASTLMRLGLIDEYRIFVNPVVIGAGTPMFKNVNDVVDLKLLSSETMQTGIVALRYQPVRKEK